MGSINELIDRCHFAQAITAVLQNFRIAGKSFRIAGNGLYIVTYNAN